MSHGWLPNRRRLLRLGLHGRKPIGRRPLLDSWFYQLTLGQPLPSLPIWLDADLGLTLDLEPSYEETCRLLRIT